MTDSVMISRGTLSEIVSSLRDNIAFLRDRIVDGGYESSSLLDERIDKVMKGKPATEENIGALPKRSQEEMEFLGLMYQQQSTLLTELSMVMSEIHDDLIELVHTSVLIDMPDVSEEEVH